MKFKGIVSCTNEQYHGEKNHLSSSNLKLLLKDPEDFYKFKILGEKKEHSTSTQNAFDEGTYAHSLILEPEMIEKEFKFFEGFRKQGKDWESFKSEYKDSGYIILSKSQKKKVENWVRAYKNLPVAKKLIQNGKSEHTIFSEIMGVPLKARADYINIDSGYLVDVKTTSNPTDVDSFKYTINSFEYDLSASLYLKLFEDYYDKEFDFYFIVLGKRDYSCEVFKMSKDTRNLGESKLIKAIQTYKKCKSTGIWEVDKPKSFDDNEISEYEILEV